MVKNVMPEDKELRSALDHMYKLATQIRGQFIDQALWMERLIEDAIVVEFFPSEADIPHRFKLLSFVLSVQDLTFSTKISILKDLLKYKHKGIFDNHPGLFKKLEKILQLRNQLAHSTLDTTKEFLSNRYEDRIQLFIFKKGEKKTQVLTMEDMRERGRECHGIIMELINVQNEIVQDIL